MLLVLSWNLGSRYFFPPTALTPLRNTASSALAVTCTFALESGRKHITQPVEKPHFCFGTFGLSSDGIMLNFGPFGLSTDGMGSFWLCHGPHDTYYWYFWSFQNGMTSNFGPFGPLRNSTMPSDRRAISP